MQSTTAHRTYKTNKLNSKATVKGRKAYRDGSVIEYTKWNSVLAITCYKNGRMSHVIYDGTSQVTAERIWADVCRDRA